MAQSLTTQTSRLQLMPSSAAASDLVADGTPVAASPAVLRIPIESAARFSPATGVLQSVSLACSVTYLVVEQTMTGDALGQTEFGVVNTVGDQTIVSVLHSLDSAGAHGWWDEPGLTSSSTIAANTLTEAALVGSGQIDFSGTTWRAQALKTSGDAGSGVYAELRKLSNEITPELAVRFEFAYLAHAIPSFQPDATVRTGLQIDLGSASAGEFVPAALVIHNRAPLSEAVPAVLTSVSGDGDFADFAVGWDGLTIQSGSSEVLMVNCLASAPGTYSSQITIEFQDVAGAYPTTVQTYQIVFDVTATVGGGVDPDPDPEPEPELPPYVPPEIPYDDPDPGRSLQGDTIDLICWRTFGHTAGITEAVYALNPGLADFGPILPIGTHVDLPATSTPEQKKTIKLWD